MKRRYETVFIATPVLSDAQMKEAVEKFSGIITAGGGSIVHDEYWGLRKLAYAIGGKSTGFYQLLEFEAEGSVIEKLETEFRRDERILRFLSFRLDKYAAQYAEKRRALKKQKETQEKA
jgi:small subunit ribosomal protein S6